MLQGSPPSGLFRNTLFKTTNLELDGLVLQYGVVGNLELELLFPDGIQRLLADARSLRQANQES